MRLLARRLSPPATCSLSQQADLSMLTR